MVLGHLHHAPRLAVSSQATFHHLRPQPAEGREGGERHSLSAAGQSLGTAGTSCVRLSCSLMARVSESDLVELGIREEEKIDNGTSQVFVPQERAGWCGNMQPRPATQA